MDAEPLDLFDLYFSYVEDTEPPLIYHRWSLIAATGAFLGRKFYMPFGSGKIYPNQYVMLIGNPGARKSTAIKTSKKVITSAGYGTFAAEKTTKEKFLLDLEDADANEFTHYGAGTAKGAGPNARDVLADLNLTAGGEESHDGVPKEVFITADEFNEFAGNGNLDFLSMLGQLWDWDDEVATYKHRFKNSKSISIFQPTISIISGNTHAGFQQAFPAAAIGQGFLSRLILVYSEPSGRKITFPKKPDDSIAVRLGEHFKAIRDRVSGEATLTKDAIRALDTIYRTWKDLEDYRFKSYSTRRQTHLYKLCLITAAMRLSTEIDKQDVILANTILSYTEKDMDKALGEYGRSKNSEAVQTIMAALYGAKDPLGVDELFKLVRRDVERREQLPELLSGLEAAGKLLRVPGQAKFLAKREAVNEKAQYVNFDLLKEHRIPSAPPKLNLVNL